MPPGIMLFPTVGKDRHNMLPTNPIIKHFNTGHLAQLRSALSAFRPTERHCHSNVAADEAEVLDPSIIFDDAPEEWL